MSSANTFEKIFSYAKILKYPMLNNSQLYTYVSGISEREKELKIN